MRKYLLTLAYLVLGYNTWSQNIYLEPRHAVRRLSDRILTIYGNVGDTTLHNNTSLLSIKELEEMLVNAKADVYNAKISTRDVYDINKFINENVDYAVENEVTNPAENPTEWKGLYNNTSHFIEKTGRSHWIMNPIFNATSITNTSEKKYYFKSAIGLELGGRIGGRFGMYANATYNIDRLTDFTLDRLHQFESIPGAGPFKTIYQDKDYTNVEYININAHASYDLIKDHVVATAGYGKLFIGDGMRSLVWSDFSAGMPYLSFRTKFWKLEYVNIFSKPISQSIHTTADQMNMNKYFSFHYLSANVFKWLQLGIYETVVSSREGAPNLGYFNPIIFYRSMERNYGSPDKMALGITAKSVFYKNMQLYGQFFINEFTAKEFFANNGYIHNKWGLQLGYKYFNVANIENLDLQLEANVVRPYAYQHRSNANFSNYNQALAHPLGANFKEYIADVQYRPFNKIGIRATVVHYNQGLNTSSVNYGSDILVDIRTYRNMYGNKIGQGIKLNQTNFQFLLSYEMFKHGYLDLGGMLRNTKLANAETTMQPYITVGVRYRIQPIDLMSY